MKIALWIFVGVAILAIAVSLTLQIGVAQMFGFLRFGR